MYSIKRIWVSKLDKLWTSALCATFLLAYFLLLATATLRAQSYSVIANFNAYTGQSPAYVTWDGHGNIYGTTFYGGRSGYLGPGVVYKVSPSDSGWKLTLLYAFTDGLDGGHPNGGITIGPDGSLYGTTNYGGTHGYGVVYKLQPPVAQCRSALCYWTETVLYNFSGQDDGAGPQGNLVFDGDGNLYGTALAAVNGTHGALYMLSPSPGGWTFHLIHTFTGGMDGGEPANGVIFDRAGNLFGVAEMGGATGNGVVYEFSRSGSGWSEAILHNFSSSGNPDGVQPGGLAIDSTGNLFGLTSLGGGSGWGTVFEVQAGSGGYTFNTIFTFTPQTGGAPGFITTPLLDAAGNVYGTGGSGGTDGAGIIFRLSPSGGGWDFAVVHNFTGQDGDEPGGTLASDAQGNIYGATENGGAYSFGVVWQLVP